MDLSTIRKAGKTLWYRFKGECIFCKIVEEKDGKIVFEDSDTMAFAPLKNGILSEGHILVISKEHYENIFDIPKSELSNLMETVKDISTKLEEETEFEGVNLLNASGKSSQQSISHFHFHLVPRTENDEEDLWPETGYEEDSYEQIYENLKKSLES